MNNNSYVDYVKSNINELAQYVNKCFDSDKASIKDILLDLIKSSLKPLPPHYDWEAGDCPYDHSGIIVQNGFVSLDQTVSEFLENEYTGNSTATYVSGCGLSYNTYGDELRDDILNLATDIMFSATKEYIEKNLNVSLSDDDFQNVKEECFDIIYDNCVASDFFWYDFIVKFVEIGNIKLSKLVTDYKTFIKNKNVKLLPEQ